MLNTRLYKLLTWIMLAILLLPVSMVQADAPQQDNPLCPPYREELDRDGTFLRQLSPECKKILRHDILSGQQSDPDVTLLSTGGPDEFGYTFDDTVNESWIPGTVNTDLVGDDEFSLIDIGFDFPFYGFTHSQVYFNTNGLLTFGEEYLWYGGEPIAQIAPPNDFIAPFWEDLLVGAGYNNGGIYYQRGGTAPNRYFVLEWRNVETFSGSALFSFEVILYENGDIVAHHLSLPVEYESTVGIENSLGDDGLEYQSGDTGLSAPNVIHFYYPTTPAARLLVSPRDAGEFVIAGETVEFPVTILNTGSLGADTYELSLAANWPYTLYAADGSTPLIDTDADTVVDTGPIEMGTSTTIVAKFTAPSDGQDGDTDPITVTVTSSLDDSKSKAARLSMTIPAGFANVFVDGADGAMRFMTANRDGTNVYKVTDDERYGYYIAVERLANGNYFYAWTNSYFNGKFWVRDIEYILFDRHRHLLRSVSKLTNNTNASMYTEDDEASIAIAPDGTIGVVWTRYVYDHRIGKNNSNVYMATLTPNGDVIKRVNLTNQTVWKNSNTLNAPSYFDLTITNSGDDRFVIAWRDERKVVGSFWKDDIWYTVRNTAAASVFPPTAFTGDGESRNPVLSGSSDGKALLTWSTFSGPGPFYSVLNSDGSVFKSTTTLGDGSYDWSSDAVQLSNGKVAVAWAGGIGIQFAILNSAYEIESGPTTAYNPSNVSAGLLSVTTDESNRVIMTWAGDYEQLYALGDDTGSFLTEPMVYGRSTYFNSSVNGQGNAPFRLASTVAPVVTSVTRADPDLTGLASVRFTVTFSAPVDGVDETDFNLVTTGITGATITKVSGYAETHTVTVKTGSGNGTIHLDVLDNGTIEDEFDNELGGGGYGDGNFTTGETYTVVKGAPGVPALLAPAEGVFVSNLQPVLDWKDSVPAAVDYQLQVATNSTFTDLVIDEPNISDSTYTLPSALERGRLYYWRVKAFNVLDGASAWSAKRTFKTPLDLPALALPADLAPLLTDRPLFDWNPVDGATQYNLQVSASSKFSTLLLNVTTNATEYIAIKDLPQNKTLYWRVRGKTSTVASPWSAKWSFKTGNPPSVPVLSVPASNALVKDYTPFINWNNSTSPANTSFQHYEIQLDDNKELSSPETYTTASGDINDSDYTPLTDLAANSTYYWRVRAINEVNGVDHTSGWSSVRWFRTVIPAPTGLSVTANGGNSFTFEWDDATAPLSGYTIQVSTTSNFSMLLVNVTTPHSFYTMTRNLPSGKALYWRVRVNGANGPSAWTTVQYTTP